MLPADSEGWWYYGKIGKLTAHLSSTWVSITLPGSFITAIALQRDKCEKIEKERGRKVEEASWWVVCWKARWQRCPHDRRGWLESKGVPRIGVCKKSLLQKIKSQNHSCPTTTHNLNLPRPGIRPTPSLSSGSPTLYLGRRWVGGEGSVAGCGYRCWGEWVTRSGARRRGRGWYLRRGMAIWLRRRCCSNSTLASPATPPSAASTPPSTLPPRKVITRWGYSFFHVLNQGYLFLSGFLFFFFFCKKKNLIRCRLCRFCWSMGPTSTPGIIADRFAIFYWIYTDQYEKWRDYVIKFWIIVGVL